MTYSAYETSLKSGDPVELYDFLVGAAHYRYTSADSDYSYSGNTYSAAYIFRDAFSITSDDNKADLNLRVARDNAVAALFTAFPPASVDLTVYRLHRSDGNAITYWKGRVVSVTWQDSEAILRCESLLSAMSRIGRCQRWQNRCRLPLYGSLCGVVSTDYDADGVITAISGNVISAVAFDIPADGWWVGGFAVFGSQRRLIMAHTGDDITLNAPITGLIVGDTVTVFAGCDHTLTTCASKFSNSRYYGGFIAVPTVNPFDPQQEIWS